MGSFKSHHEESGDWAYGLKFWATFCSQIRLTANLCGSHDPSPELSLSFELRREGCFRFVKYLSAFYHVCTIQFWERGYSLLADVLRTLKNQSLSYIYLSMKRRTSFFGCKSRWVRNVMPIFRECRGARGKSTLDWEGGRGGTIFSPVRLLSPVASLPIFWMMSDGQLCRHPVFVARKEWAHFWSPCSMEGSSCILETIFSIGLEIIERHCPPPAPLP